MGSFLFNRKAINGLPGQQRKQVREIVRTHMKDVNLACADATKGKMAGLVNLPTKLISAITRGAAIGTSITAIVNSLFPGLFNTMCGFMAASAPQIWQKLASLGIGFVTDQAIAGKIMLAAGAAVGAVLYSAGGAGIAAIKGIRKLHQRRKKDEVEV